MELTRSIYQEDLRFHYRMQLALSIYQQLSCLQYHDFDYDHRLVIVDICAPCTKFARYVKQTAIYTKMPVNLNYLKQPDISELFVNTFLEKLKNLDLSSTIPVMNDYLISSINFATEETLPMREKHDYTSHSMIISY